MRRPRPGTGRSAIATTCRTLLIACAVFGLQPHVFALGQTQFIEEKSSSGAFTIADKRSAAMIFADLADWPGVVRAAHDLQADVQRVTGLSPALITDARGLPGNVIIVGTIGKSPVIDQLIRDKKIDAGAVTGQWESYVIQVVPNPMPGVASALVIAGSDKRGTIYGIYDVSEQMGVSPWYYWADVPAKHRDAVYVKAGKYTQGPPSVKYRGIFLNDEAPDLTEWIKEKYGSVPNGIGGTTANYGRQFYTNLFELMLRIKANYLWPAMWNNRFSMDDPMNAPLADMYGIVTGTSHQDPLLRSEKEWTWGPGNNPETRDRNYAMHPDALNAFWREGLVMNSNYESILTLGLRGAGDRPMIAGATDEQSMDLLKNIIEDQRKLIAEVVNPDVTKVPQLWCPYKEVQGYYEKGLRVPDDVTILWAEDNNGNLRRVPTADERKRSGAAGIYYHMDYVGGPRNYKWINTSPIAKVYDQMSLAKQYGADRIWIVNVGHFKGLELPMQYFMDLGYNSGRWNNQNLGDYMRQWAAQQFGPDHAADIADIMDKYSKFNGRRKPEQLEPSTFSLLNYNEAETVVADWQAIADKAVAINAKLPEAQRAAFYELVLFPAQACANLTELYVAAGQNALYAKQGRASAGDKAVETKSLFAKDADMMKYYNKTFLDGKWDHFMDQAHIGYNNWQDPSQNNLNAISLAEPRATGAAAAPAAEDPNAAPARRGGGFGRGGRGGARNTVLPDVPDEAIMGVAVEGTEIAFVGGEETGPTLPRFDSFNQQRHYIEVFNKGKAPFAFTAKASDSWIKLSEAKGSVDKDQRLWVSVDWAKAPKGAATGTVTLTGLTNNVIVKVDAFNPTEVTRQNLQGFVESDGVVSIEPEHFTKKIDVDGNRWERIDGYGRTLSGMRATSPSDGSLTPQKDSPSLAYRMYLFSTNPVEVDAITSPILNIFPDRGIQLAMSLDNGEPQVVTVVPKGYGPQGQNWETSVKDNARHIKTTLNVDQPGYHTLNIWMVDPGVTVQKIVVNAGGLKPSYLGPPESYHNGALGVQASVRDRPF